MAHWTSGNKQGVGSSNSLNSHVWFTLGSDGALNYLVPLALNEPPGLWKIVVRDLFQCGEASASIEIKPAQ